MKNKFGFKVLILGCKCYRCGHEWRPNNLDIPPIVCPKCNNPYWNKPKRKAGGVNNDRRKQGKKTGRKNC